MERKLILTLDKHYVYYVKTNAVNFYITIPKTSMSSNISIELKSKMENYNLELNDELWVMENVKNTFSFIDEYNITLVLPVLKEEEIDALEKIDTSKFEQIDYTIASLINESYKMLIESKIEVSKEIILVNNDRYKTFINWFITKYRKRVSCRNLLELIQLYNADATSYKKLETPVMNFVVGSYSTEVDAPKIENKEIEKEVQLEPVLAPSGGFASYLLLAIVIIAVVSVGAIIIFLK